MKLIENDFPTSHFSSSKKTFLLFHAILRGKQKIKSSRFSESVGNRRERGSFLVTAYDGLRPGSGIYFKIELRQYRNWANSQT
jgi:hypothetical protein